MTYKHILLAFMAWASTFSYASEIDNTHAQSLKQQALANELYADNQWQRLVYYEHHVTRGWVSQADDEAFFNAPNGKHDPKAELLATLDVFLKPVNSNKSAHAICRFPARFSWLSKRLSNLANHAPSLVCKEFDDWLNKIQPASATLVFPSAYINSPSSMFGHTLIRVDSAKHAAHTDILGHSISYAAQMPDKVSGWAYIKGGLFGGYPGFMYEATYYDKIIEYNDIEARDIWEYPLALTPEQLSFLMKHVWELQKVRFDYYFFDENCALRLLNILDIAVPNLNSSDGFSTHAIPSDTVRALSKTDILMTPSYRPSALTELKIRKRQFSAKEQRFILKLALSDQAAESILNESLASNEKKAQMMDFAFDYLRYLARRDPFNKKKHGDRSIKLLSLRSRLPKIEPEVIPPPVSPENGHGTARLALSSGQIAHQDVRRLAIRPAFHDVTDDDRGYVKGAQIDFLSLYGRYLHQQEELQLERFELIDIKALSPRDRFFKPLSWGINLGWRRVDEASAPMHFGVKGGGGVTQEVASWMDVSVLAKTDIRVPSDFEKLDIGAGAHVSALVSLPFHSKLRLVSEWWEYEGRSASDANTQNAVLNIPMFSVNHALRLEGSVVRNQQATVRSAFAGWQYYF